MSAQAKLTVRALRTEESARYEQWLAGLPNVWIHATTSFAALASAASDSTATVLVGERGGRFTGSLLYCRRVVPGLGVVLNALPWYGSHGGCWLEDFGDGDTREALLAAYVAVVAREKPLFWNLIAPPSEESAMAVYRKWLQPTTTDTRTGQVTTLPANTPDIDDRLFSVLAQKTRNLVRKALRQGFTEEVRDDNQAWAFLHELHLENIQAVGGNAKPREHFDSLREAIAPERRRLSVACVDGTPVAALLLLYFGHTVEYFTPAIRAEFRPRQPLSFLIWNAMVDAIKRGYRKWNWGGTWHSQASLQHFKRGWGAEDLPYTYLVGASGQGLSALAENPDRLKGAYRYFYLYPFASLTLRTSQ